MYVEHKKQKDCPDEVCEPVEVHQDKGVEDRPDENRELERSLPRQKVRCSEQVFGRARGPETGARNRRTASSMTQLWIHCGTAAAFMTVLVLSRWMPR